jgi:hypothetical protein
MTRQRIFVRLNADMVAAAPGGNLGVAAWTAITRGHRVDCLSDGQVVCHPGLRVALALVGDSPKAHLPVPFPLCSVADVVLPFRVCAGMDAFCVAVVEFFGAVGAKRIRQRYQPRLVRGESVALVALSQLRPMSRFHDWVIERCGRSSRSN